MKYFSGSSVNSQQWLMDESKEGKIMPFTHYIVPILGYRIFALGLQG